MRKGRKIGRTSPFIPLLEGDRNSVSRMGNIYAPFNNSSILLSPSGRGCRGKKKEL